jgi:hypothetical protein
LLGKQPADIGHSLESTFVRGGSKTLVAACVALLLAMGLIACGGGDSSDSTGGAADDQSQTSSTAGEDTSQGNEGKSSTGAGKGDGAPSDSSDAADFAPKQHEDSGGGSEQFKVKGGDNSVQEFGEEADSTELDAAAVALHNFLDARAEANWAAACDYMSQSTIKSFEQLASQSQGLEGASCGEVLEQVTNPAARSSMKAEAENANVGSLRLEGEQAFVIYTGVDGTILAMPMANEGGEWKVASLAGTPLN